MPPDDDATDNKLLDRFRKWDVDTKLNFCLIFHGIETTDARLLTIPGLVRANPRKSTTSGGRRTTITRQVKEKMGGLVGYQKQLFLTSRGRQLVDLVASNDDNEWKNLRTKAADLVRSLNDLHKSHMDVDPSKTRDHIEATDESEDPDKQVDPLDVQVSEIDRRFRDYEAEIRTRMWEIQGRLSYVEGLTASKRPRLQDDSPDELPLPSKIIWLWNIVNAVPHDTESSWRHVMRRLLMEEKYDKALQLYQNEFPDIIDMVVNCTPDGSLSRRMPYFWWFMEEMIAFPDRTGHIPVTRETQDLGIAGRVTRYPLLLQGNTVGTRKNKSVHWNEPKVVQELPQLPQNSGFIHERDANAFPTRVEETPAKSEHDAYFWVRPEGLKAVVGPLWVWNRHAFGLAIWWPPTHRSKAIVAVFSGEGGRPRPTTMESRETEFLRKEYLRLKRLLDRNI